MAETSHTGPVEGQARWITGMLIGECAKHVNHYHVDFISDYDVLVKRLPSIQPELGDSNGRRCAYVVSDYGTHMIWGLKANETVASAITSGGLRSYAESGHVYELSITVKASKYGGDDPRMDATLTEVEYKAQVK